MTPEEFYAQYMPYAQSVSQSTGLDPRLVLAQSALETGYGKSAPNMNFFGIKSHGRAGGNTLQTSEFEGGKMVGQPASFRGYDGPAQSFQDYANFIMSNPRYEGVRSAQGLDDQIAEMAKSGYATDPEYGAKLASIASRFDPSSPPIIGADAMRAIGRQPQGILATEAATTTEGPQMIEEQQPQGLLGTLGIQKMQEGAAGETGQRFYERDTFKDTAATLAEAFAGLGNNPALQKAAAGIASQRTEAKARNKTVEYLRANGRGDLADMVESGDVSGKDVMGALINKDIGGTGADGVQSSKALPDQSGVVMTMRDGSIVVKTIGGETLTGQAALDFARTANENYAGYQSDVYGARTRGTNLAETDTGAAAAAAGAAGEAMVKRGYEAFDQAQNASTSLASIDEAIAAIDDGAESGLVYKFIPDVTEASASLNVAMNKMGLDVISSVTFGALSVAEMNLAMQTAVPRDLSPPELRSWLVSKRDAQAKTRDALMKAASYLTTPGNTLQGWLDQQSEAESVAPPVATRTDADLLKQYGVLVE